MSTIEALEELLKLDKNDDFVLTVNILPSYDGSYRITVVTIYSHRYTRPITVKGKITVKQIRMTISMTTFISSSPEVKQCPICKGWIYECHVNGFRTRVEPTPLNFQTEVAMRIAGRSIFQTLGVEATLIPRRLWHIQQADPRAKVFASHDCQTPEIFEPAPINAPIRISSHEGIPF